MSLLLCLFVGLRGLINSFVCWLCTDALGLIPCQIVAFDNNCELSAEKKTWSIRCTPAFPQYHVNDYEKRKETHTNNITPGLMICSGINETKEMRWCGRQIQNSVWKLILHWLCHCPGIYTWTKGYNDETCRGVSDLGLPDPSSPPPPPRRSPMPPRKFLFSAKATVAKHSSTKTFILELNTDTIKKIRTRTKTRSTRKLGCCSGNGRIRRRAWTGKINMKQKCPLAF